MNITRQRLLSSRRLFTASEVSKRQGGHEGRLPSSTEKAL